jgi:hypothetical protein
MTAGPTRLSVIAEQVALNEGRVAGRIIRQAYAGDVVLDDVVNDVSAGGSSSQIDPKTSEGPGRTILHREAINNYIVRSHVHSTAVLQDRFRSGARSRANTDLGSLQGDRLVHREYARDRIGSRGNDDSPAH